MWMKADQIGKPDFLRRKTKDVGRIFGPERKLSSTEIFAPKMLLKNIATSGLIETKQTFAAL